MRQNKAALSNILNKRRGPERPGPARTHPDTPRSQSAATGRLVNGKLQFSSRPKLGGDIVC